MKRLQYLVRINRDPASDWGASVPDLPGCVATGKTIDSALRRSLWCSNDPVCMESPGDGAVTSNLAACHGCALLPETSCEEGNRLLDRGLLVGSIDNPSLGFFHGAPIV